VTVFENVPAPAWATINTLPWENPSDRYRTWVYQQEQARRDAEMDLQRRAELLQRMASQQYQNAAQGVYNTINQQEAQGRLNQSRDINATDMARWRYGQEQARFQSPGEVYRNLYGY